MNQRKSQLQPYNKKNVNNNNNINILNIIYSIYSKRYNTMYFSYHEVQIFHSCFMQTYICDTDQSCECVKRLMIVWYYIVRRGFSHCNIHIQNYIHHMWYIFASCIRSKLIRGPFAIIILIYHSDKKSAS